MQRNRPILLPSPSMAPAPTPRPARLAAALVLLPLLPFYAILLRYGVNIPLEDDYDAILNFLDRLHQLHPGLPRLVYVLTAQHNEYKLVFLHGLVWLQASALHHIDFRLTCFLGNITVVFIGLLLWKMFLPTEPDLRRRLLLYLPVSLLLFQLNYVGTLDWAMTSLQHLPGMLFSLAALYFLVQKTPTSYTAALLALVLAIAASGNGFFLVPIGLLALLLDRRYLRAAGWLAASAVCIAGYAYRYVTPPPPGVSAQNAARHVSLLTSVLHVKPLYFLAFVGSAAAYPRFLSYFLGLALLACFVWALRLGYFRANPLVCYCVLFLLITAAGVTVLRSSLDFKTFMSSRYRIHCDLMLIFVWFFYVERFLQHHVASLRHNRVFVSVLSLCCLFAVLQDAYGFYVVHKRAAIANEGMALYEHPQPGQPAGPVLPLPDEPPARQAWESNAHRILDRSIQQGTYLPPQLPIPEL